MFGFGVDQDWLSISSNIAQAVTGLVAGIAGIKFVCQRRVRRTRLEAYLTESRREAEVSGGHGAKSIQHLMGNCLMTEAQVMEAAFSSNRIQSWLTVGADGLAGKLLFQLSDEAWQKSQKVESVRSRSDHKGAAVERQMKSDIGALSAGVIAVAVSMMGLPGPYTLISVALSTTALFLIFGYALGHRRPVVERMAVAMVTAFVGLPLAAYLNQLVSGKQANDVRHFVFWIVLSAAVVPVDWLLAKARSAATHNSN